MTDKRRARRTIKDLQRVKTWQLLILLLLAGFISATFLRLNNIGMVERRSAVIAADEVGDSEVTIQRLYDLQQYVSSHMNSDMGKGVYLDSSYERDTQAIYNKATSSSNPNGNIYKKAQEVCAPRFSSWSPAYIQCTTSELAKYPAATDLTKAIDYPSPDTYLHAFVSPFWSPDFAGWSLVVCAVLILMIVVRLIGILVLKLILRRHYQSV